MLEPHPFEDYLSNLATKDCSNIGSKQESEDAGGHYYKNIKAITQGYNIYRGDPLSRIDQGFTGSQVFALDWTSVSRQGGARRHPLDVDVSSNFGCSSTLTTTTVRNAREYQEEIAGQAEIGAGLALVGAFTASAGYKRAERTMAGGEAGIATATAQCNLFTMTYSLPPCLSENLETALSLLKTAPSEAELNEFIDRFGTHAIRRLDMGAKFVATATFDKSEFVRSKSQGR